ncbi:ankyrin repeat domain-containing protein [Brevundimonas sp. TWP2-3-2]|uniref:ankyrin repeat domain-containing protein n=1 Tax=unclassified Brevundimonas TaxID=2622653 RepID=UPI003CEA8FA2
MTEDEPLWCLLKAIVAADALTVDEILAACPAISRAVVTKGASRGEPDVFLPEIQHHVYAGDTALHIAAAAYQLETVRQLIGFGAHVAAANRRGAQPLHYAADGMPGSDNWNPAAQAAVIASLVSSGADPDAIDKSGVTPLHRAVRKRCAAAVEALLASGADPLRRNGKGSTPMMLAIKATGRGGSGAPVMKAQQAEIIRMLG